MKYLRSFNEGEGGQYAPKSDKYPKTFCILTQQASDRRNAKGDQPVSYAHDGFHFQIDDANELRELENKHKTGGKYLGEDIIGTQVLDYLIYN
jgi:hypothetical protein